MIMFDNIYRLPLNASYGVDIYTAIRSISTENLKSIQNTTNISNVRNGAIYAIANALEKIV